MSIEIIFSKSAAIKAGAHIEAVRIMDSYIDEEGQSQTYEDDYTTLEIPDLKVVCYEIANGGITVQASRGGSIKPVLTKWLDSHSIAHTVE